MNSCLKYGSLTNVLGKTQVEKALLIRSRFFGAFVVFALALSPALPNFPKLYQLLPAGLPGLAFTLLVSSSALVVLTSVFGETPDLAKIAFVLLPIPSTILGLLGMFGREPADQDVRWYQRTSLTWLYRIGGIAIFVATLRLTGII